MSELVLDISGDKELAIFLNSMPRIYLATLSIWLRDERARFLGGKNARGKYKKGYRDILDKKRLKKRAGTWDSRITGLFKGYMPKALTIEQLEVTMGILGRSKHQLHKALEMHQTGGTITSSSYMPVPIYKNLRRTGYTGPWSRGSVKTGLRSKAFASFAGRNRLVGMKSQDKWLFFDRESEREKKSTQGPFKKSGLLFVGTKKITIEKSLSGRFDFENRFDRMSPAMLIRGQKAINRATRKAQKK